MTRGQLDSHCRMSKPSPPLIQFSKMQKHAYEKLYLPLLREKVLRPLDWVILCGFACNATPAGRSMVSVSEVGENAGISLNQARQSLSRLRDADFIRKGRLSTGYFFMVNPKLFNEANHRGDTNRNEYDEWVSRYHQLEGPEDRRRKPCRGLEATLRAIYA